MRWPLATSLAILLARAPAGAQERAGEEAPPPAPVPRKVHAPPPVALLRVVSTPPGARVELDGGRLGTAPLVARVAPGTHRLVATLEGHAAAAAALELDGAGAQLLVSLARLPEPCPAPPPPPPPPAPAPGLTFDEAMARARSRLKVSDYRAAFALAETALAQRALDAEAQMIATIAACGLGARADAQKHVPRAPGSYRDLALRRCSNLGVEVGE